MFSECIQDYLPELKTHFAECILADILDNQNVSADEISTAMGSVLFKNDHIYDHKVFHVNYTTYDPCHTKDVINLDTSHCNIMFLNGTQKNADLGLYLYARVLWVCHANIVYVGLRAVNYQPCQMDFLWVRWHEQVDLGCTGCRV